MSDDKVRAFWHYSGLKGKPFYDATIYRDHKIKRRVMGDKDLRAFAPRTPEAVRAAVHTKLTDDEIAVLKEVMTLNPMIAPGIAGSTLYRLLVSLREKRLVIREGYRYYPTKYGYLALERKDLKLKDLTPSKEETAKWTSMFTGALQKRFAGPSPTKRPEIPPRRSGVSAPLRWEVQVCSSMKDTYEESLKKAAAGIFFQESDCARWLTIGKFPTREDALEFKAKEGKAPHSSRHHVTGQYMRVYPIYPPVKF